MALTSTGKKKLCSYAFIIALDIVVLALSVSVNIFQEFFFVADLFPLLLSIVTLAIFLLQVVLDLTSKNAFTARPAFEIPLLGTLTIVWLAFNAFSTSRYTDLPDCSVFDDVPDERTWCRNVQGLRVFIWLEWAALLLNTIVLARISIVEARRGNTAVWRTALSHYRPNSESGDFVQDASSFYRGSSIFGFGGASGHQKDPSMSSRDWFAPAEPVIRLSSNVDSQRHSPTGSFYSAGRAGLGIHGNGAQSAVSLQQQFQSSNPSVTRTVDGFEIVTGGGYYFQNEGNWNQGGPQYRS